MPSEKGRGRERFAMLPESVITGELIPGITTQRRLMAFLVYSYVDLKQGDDGWPVRSLRHIAKEIGVQERTVKEAVRTLEEAGLVEVVRSGPPHKSTVVEIVHNPARGRRSPNAKVGPTATRYRHETQTYEPQGGQVHRLHGNVHGLHPGMGDPVAQVAAGSRSMRSGSSGEEAAVASGSTLSDESRCGVCLLLTEPPKGRGAEPEEFCGCSFGATGMHR